MYHDLALKLNDCRIKPGIGFGPIHLGMTRDEVFRVLGRKPHSEEKDSDIRWCYFDFSLPYVNWADPGLTLVFDELEQFKLTYINISRGLYADQFEKIELFGVKIAALNSNEISDLLTENGENHLERKISGDLTTLSAEDLQLTIVLDKKTVEYISVFPYVLDNGEYKWA